MNKVKLRKKLQEFFIEDLGELDLTSEYIFPLEKVSKGNFLVKNDGVLAGVDILKEAYAFFDPSIEVTLYKQDGELVKTGDVIASVNGPVAYLLSAERVILNLMQRMSGVATATHAAVQALNSDHTRICDTRKTMPGLRMLDKYAVRCGGGYNHRFGLYDGVMIKDNHITFAGGIKEAVSKVRSQAGHMVKIEVETESKEQVLEAVEAGADVIMFDNRSPEEVAEYVKLVPKGIVTEISGGLTLETIGNYRDTMVDYISLGMLTHSVTALDISFNLEGGVK
ncbi:nicotinate-nucleotide pyrophosphorylase (carboxylating) [Schinkia azotoformans MEV2011]|uniref:Probable nicotinate-nucleotide pyrophosphorylase [carboxylating] n=1 Tax=Schinkia azotoformans MEV2011 TaxID=1348973 RepID=A0A072NQ90_SCHAZ|nr:carboxylating nicotinate-nucleotide diphosphorylase [Schinkia azotoformans]KEF39422.1 nicotinate-nucleotide pyrophosphorylase (carboxylating) [Schinkia azotoformans MEV2011]MEC1696806.1 carboxylating nicotinate-nucleotide diphosphorylase [Schinkia azotoformans]MEC1717943.1 carboxylating nicotinate-nucleotide diphosphorylase [Schinkia azotoformans]MEC1726661.1 carboxylating nicotinate-nucleotide diphosphorylase [Schinkia azotoformans]MEC1739853.1 carboxylating nicotinate-nucleotide diphospho